MSKYVVLSHETDIKDGLNMLALHTNPLKVDNDYMKQHGLCECLNFTFPTVRELKIYEFQVLEPCSQSFESLLSRIGYASFKTNKMVLWLIKKLLKKFTGMQDGSLELLDIHSNRHNSRSIIMFKKKDEEFLINKNFKSCPDCKKNIPYDWL